MKYENIREEELKNKVAQDYFWLYDCSQIIGNVDFCVAKRQIQDELFEQESLLWAEAKAGMADIYKSIVQLILTIGKARTFDKFLPPPMLGAFDAEKIAFIPYNEIHDIFYQNDFNWNVAPSNHDTKEFRLILDRVQKTIDDKALLFFFRKDHNELIKFIKLNFVVGKFGFTKTRIDKNNFMVIYNKWLQSVKPTIAVNWDIAKKSGIIDGDFYLADILSQDNNTLKEKLFVLLRSDHYELDRKIDDAGMFSSKRTDFTDKQVAHTQFWNRYDRPPKEEYWDYIVERRNLLVPQDVRERKGSFFTPQQWVELSQRYIADALGEDWQDEYYVWDCAAGTGNLLAGLTNKYNIWASTLDVQDVEVMKDRIRNGANLLESHVFQFDFLNDEFTKLPQPLQDIINNPEKRKKLVVYINPPYAEATSATTITGIGKNKAGVAIIHKTREKYKQELGKASNELFTQFLMRIYCEIPTCKIANFSTLKVLQTPNFKVFRDVFQAKLEKLFLVPADTFDNVKGFFPIGFFIWNGEKNENFKDIKADLYGKKGESIGEKKIFANSEKTLNKWIVKYKKTENKSIIGLISMYPPDFQNNTRFSILSKSQERYCLGITENNIIPFVVYFSVRYCMKKNQYNEYDQFLYPNDDWKKDKEFQNDCLIFTLFHGKNRISSKEGTNHWIPFSEQEVNAPDKFESNFMSDFLRGKIKPEIERDLFTEVTPSIPLTEGESPVNSPSVRGLEGVIGVENTSAGLIFSAEATAVFDAGLALWRYYHSQPNYNVNASLYDIKEHFQGRDANGRMKNKSGDDTYSLLINTLRNKLDILAKKIEPKVYEYGFLKK